MCVCGTALEREGDVGQMRVTAFGRWFIRTIAALFDPEQQRRASGTRLI